MFSSTQIPVRCPGCRQLYHVPPSADDRPARCRRCTHDFVISATPTNGPAQVRSVTANHPARSATVGFLPLHSYGTSWREWLKRKGARAAIYIVLTGVFMSAVLIVIWSRHVDVGNLERGRVARLSAPRSDFEFRSVTELIESIEPSVVQIETNIGLGSGFVLDETGLIVTCYHCIENAGETEVIFEDGWRAAVIGVCKAAPELDLAIVSIHAPRRLAALPLASRMPKKGTPVVAFGSPAGLSFTVSEGSVSGLRSGSELLDLNGPFRGSLRGDREFSLSRDVRLVQITSSTMPGNSGGPVVDFLGNVVGISAFGLNWNGQILEFCISAEEIRRIASNLDEVTPL